MIQQNVMENIVFVFLLTCCALFPYHAIPTPSCTMQDDCQHCRSMAQQDGMRWQIKGQYVHAQPPYISQSSTVAVSSIRIESYIPYGRLNHFCGSRSHSPQPPRVNVNSTIRKAPGRSLQHLLSLASSYSSHFMQRGRAVATDLG